MHKTPKIKNKSRLSSRENLASICDNLIIFFQLVRRHLGFFRHSRQRGRSLTATPAKPSSRRAWWLRTRRPRAAPAPITIHRRRRPRMQQREAGQPPASNSGATTTTAGESRRPSRVFHTLQSLPTNLFKI